MYTLALMNKNLFLNKSSIKSSPKHYIDDSVSALPS